MMNPMQENKEIVALFHLIDDPDQEVFDSVSSRIVSYGRGIIPNLENLWENTISNDVQERIELLIHKLHYHDLTEDFQHWKSSSYQDLLTASLLVAKFQYPELVTTPGIAGSGKASPEYLAGAEQLSHTAGTGERADQSSSTIITD
jgi:hypothetical protein